MELLKHVFFINLEERKDRLEHTINEFKKLNINNSERFNAVKTKSGAIGCSLSHIKCLELAKERGYEQIFICEDDITFLNPELLLENLTKFNEAIKQRKFDNLLYRRNKKNGEFESSAHENGWDVIIIGGNNGPPSIKILDFCRRVYNCQTGTGYIVKKHYYDVLINNMKEGVRQLIKNPDNKHQYTLDMYWKLLQQHDNWFMIIPPTVIQYGNYSNIEKKNVDYKQLMLDLDKDWLFPQRNVENPIKKESTPTIIPNPTFYNMTYHCGK